jgi:hypothetical protein
MRGIENTKYAAYLIDRSRWVVQESAETHETVVITSFDIAETALAHWLLLLVPRTIDRQIHFVRCALCAKHIAAQFAMVLGQ